MADCELWKNERNDEDWSALYRYSAKALADIFRIPTSLFGKAKPAELIAPASTGKTSLRDAIWVLLLIQRYREEHKTWPDQDALSKEYNLPLLAAGDTLIDLLSHGWVSFLSKYRRWKLTREGRFAMSFATAVFMPDKRMTIREELLAKANSAKAHDSDKQPPGR